MKRFSDHDIAAVTNTLQKTEEFVFLESSRVTPEDHCSLLFTRPLRWLTCTAGDSPDEFLQEVDRWRTRGKYLAGWIAYEFGYTIEAALNSLAPAGRNLSSPARPLAVLGVFDQPLIFDHSSGLLPDLGFSGETPSINDELFHIEDVRTNISREEYLAAIHRIKEYIAAGHTYQVNYTMKLNFSYSGSLASMYRILRRNQSVSYGAWIRRGGLDIMSFSPELFYRTDSTKITVRPMKGTLPRGRTSSEDAAGRKFLQEDTKNRSENIMIVDLLRNDLGRLLYNVNGGRVQPRSIFDVETYESLLQMTSTVDGLLDDGRQPSMLEIMKAIFPCGSITGAPKIRTMEIIHELEKEPRGVYCGAIGYTSPDRTVFNVPIRTMVLDGGNGEMGIGSGIIHDSDPEAEWNESLLKANFLTRATPDFQLIETILWQPGTGYWLLDEHMQRLGDSAAYFLFTFDPEELQQLLRQQARQCSSYTRVRVLLFRDGRLEITAHPLLGFQAVNPFLPQEPDPLPVVSFSEQVVETESSYLFHKTTHRKLYDDARKQAADQGVYEILFTNSKGEATEGSITNIFVEQDGQLVTPPVECGLLNGTFRRFLLNHNRVREQIISRLEVEQADAVFVGNSIRGMVRVRVLPGA